MINTRFLLFLALWTLAGCGLAVGQKDASAIVQRSVAANKRDWDAVPKFDCSERDRTSDGTKTYEDIMILGTPYQRLVEESTASL